MGAIATFAKLAPRTSAPQWLAPVRSKGQTLWQAAAWPNRKTEHWRYTNLKAIDNGGFQTAPAEPSTDALDALKGLSNIAGLNAARVVLVDGCYAPSLSDVTPLSDLEGITVVPFSQANTAQANQILQHLDGVVDHTQHLFSALNAQVLSEGVFIEVAPNTVVNVPIHVVLITTQASDNCNVNARLLVVAGANSELNVVEQFVSVDEAHTVFTNNVTELVLAAGAKLKHYRLNQEHESTRHIGGVHARLYRAAKLNSFYLAYGSDLKRIDLVVDYLGEGAESHLNGVYLPRNEQHVDIHTCVEHRVPHCTTQEVFRGVVGDSAKAVFNGRIHIHPKAQKTLAQLSNKNLLTSPKAEVNTKPELEIYADDVQCAHGATVAQLDSTALHYLRSRGISAEEAKVMLSFGFINEIINTVELTAIGDFLRPQLAILFARDPALARHLL